MADRPGPHAPIREAVWLDVPHGRGPAFEAAFERAQHLLAATPGHLGHELQRDLDEPGRYLLLVRWTVVERRDGVWHIRSYDAVRQVLREDG